MKTIAAFGLMLLTCACFGAQTSTNSVTYQTVNNATNSGNAFALTSVSVPAVTYIIQQGGLATTNALYINVQFSFDNANWATLTNFYFTATNAAVATFTPNLTPATVYVRAQACTTNSVSVGVTALHY